MEYWITVPFEKESYLQETMDALFLCSIGGIAFCSERHQLMITLLLERLGEESRKLKKEEKGDPMDTQTKHPTDAQTKTDTELEWSRELAEALFKAICGDFQTLNDEDKLRLIRLYSQISDPLRGKK